MATSGDQIASEIREISAADELGQSFLPYSLSVITARALPDVRDGLKPVQRRIIVAMDGLGLRPGSPHRKSARVVGETMGNYHPHGDSAIYEALVRMAQDFSMSVPLVDPHGNFGSPDDPPAASRYTECRLTQMAMELLGELDEETVDFRATYDGEGEEPEYLPARFPNLLVNGSSGIAVGMATNMAPHNLREIANLVELVMTKRRPKPTVEEMMEVLPGPDFPTGATIVDDGGIHEAYETGRGSIRMRATVEIAQVSPRRTGIIVTELPYNVGPERVMARIKDLILSNKLSGIADMKNLSDRKHGLRLQIECKTGVNPRAVLADLYRMTPMEETFGINNVALVDGQPTTLPLYALCQHWIDHRLDVIVKRTEYRMRKAQDRGHILEGLLIALDNIDRVIAIIRGSKDVGEARTSLMSEFNLSEIQANHILDMQLRRLTQLARIDIEEELAKLQAEISDYEKLLGSEQRRRTLVIKELREIAEEHGGPRRTKIIGEDEKPVFVPDEADALDIGDEPCVVTLSTSGLVGREAAENTRTGKLSRHDLLAADVVTSTSSTVWAITDKGRALTVRAAEVPEVAGRSRGAAAQEMFALTRAEMILGLFGDTGDAIVLVTANGVAKRLTREELAGAKTGSNVISFKGDDRLVAAFATPEQADIVMVSADAQALRTPVGGIPAQGRNASGVSGMKLKGATKVVGAGLVGPDGVLLTATDGMSAKLTPMAEIPSKGRSTGGVRVTKFRGFETQLWFAFASPDRNLMVFVGQSDTPTKPEPEPIPLEIEVSRRDAASSVIDRRVLQAGKARW